MRQVEETDKKRRMGENGVNDRGYTNEQQLQLNDLKKTHQQTTESAQRALMTANQTRQLAKDTLEDLHTQGEKLQKVDRDLENIDDDVKEAKSLLKYMRRCCLCFLFACCCDCDPHVERDNQRGKRVKARRQVRQHDAQLVNMDREHRLQADREDGAVRSELIGTGRPAPRADGTDIGEGLHKLDRDEIRRQTDTQNVALDGISAALGDLDLMSKEMGSELDEQNQRIDATGMHADTAHNDLRSMQRGARKDFGLRVK